MWNGPYKLFRGFENAKKTCPNQQKSDTKAIIVINEVLKRSLTSDCALEDLSVIDGTMTISGVYTAN